MVLMCYVCINNQIDPASIHACLGLHTLVLSKSSVGVEWISPKGISSKTLSTINLKSFVEKDLFFFFFLLSDLFLKG